MHVEPAAIQPDGIGGILTCGPSPGLGSPPADFRVDTYSNRINNIGFVFVTVPGN